MAHKLKHISHPLRSDVEKKLCLMAKRRKKVWKAFEFRRSGFCFVSPFSLSVFHLVLSWLTVSLFWAFLFSEEYDMHITALIIF
jgi:hypothetical protein